jgi:protein-tyrosine phosphatase
MEATIFVSVMLMGLAYPPVIDLHCHVLPGIDDGPATLAESLTLAAELAADGVRRVAATPHVRPDHPGVVISELTARRTELQSAIEAEGIELEVLAGGEVDLVYGLEQDDDDLRALTLGGNARDLLVETPYGTVSALFEEQLFSLTMRGFRILLAHPERNHAFQKNPERLAHLAGRGVLLQVTAGALLSLPRRSAAGRVAAQLVERGLASVLATDAHGGDIKRGLLSEGLEAARELVGPQAAVLVEDAPAAILASRPLPPAPQRQNRRGRFGRRLLRRGLS